MPARRPTTAADTKIEWAHDTFNHVRGCEKVSDGCRFCYAEALSKRFPDGRMGEWGPTGTRVVASESYWRQPLKWNREAKAASEKAGRRIPRRVFCASLADVFEDREDVVEARARLFALIERTPHLTWMLLTKRPENIIRLAEATTGWPENVWIGASVENQAAADARIPHLLEVPAAVRFLSCEPLLGPVDLTFIRGLIPGDRHGRRYQQLNALNGYAYGHGEHPRYYPGDHSKIGWVIAGGESGPKARPMHPDWARSIRDQCVAAGVPFFFKQHGEFIHVTEISDGGTKWEEKMERIGKKFAGRLLDGREWNEFPEEDAK